MAGDVFEAALPGIFAAMLMIAAVQLVAAATMLMAAAAMVAVAVAQARQGDLFGHVRGLFGVPTTAGAAAAAEEEVEPAQGHPCRALERPVNAPTRMPTSFEVIEPEEAIPPDQRLIPECEQPAVYEVGDQQHLVFAGEQQLHFLEADRHEPIVTEGTPFDQQRHILPEAIKHDVVHAHVQAVSAEGIQSDHQRLIMEGEALAECIPPDQQHLILAPGGGAFSSCGRETAGARFRRLKLEAHASKMPFQIVGATSAYVARTAQIFALRLSTSAAVVLLCPSSAWPTWR